MTKNKRKKRSKKIFIAILMILFSGVVLTASTYAWFTANKTVTVDKIEVNAEYVDLSKFYSVIRECVGKKISDLGSARR